MRLYVHAIYSNAWVKLFERWFKCMSEVIWSLTFLNLWFEWQFGPMEPVDIYVKFNFVMINECQYVEITYINANTNETVRKEILPYEQD